jgi:hypothetical protein
MLPWKHFGVEHASEQKGKLGLTFENVGKGFSHEFAHMDQCVEMWTELGVLPSRPRGSTLWWSMESHYPTCGTQFMEISPPDGLI